MARFVATGLAGLASFAFIFGREWLATWLVAHDRELAEFISSPAGLATALAGFWILWAAYWLGIHRPRDEDRQLAARWEQGLEDIITRDYKDQADSVEVSEEGQKHEPAPDFERKRRYDQVGLADLFRPDPSRGHKTLVSKIDEAEALLDAITEQGLTDALLQSVLDWERRAREDVEFYMIGWIGRSQARGFARRTIRQHATPEGRVKALRAKVNDLRLYAGGQAKQAAAQARRRAWSRLR